MKMKLVNILIICLLVGVNLFGREKVTLKGRVVDSSDNTPIASAIVYISETRFYVYTNDNGEFEIPDLNKGKYPLQVARLGYKAILQHIEINDQSPSDVLIKLIPQPLQAEEILVTSTPFTLVPQSEISNKEIREKYPKDISVFLKEKYSEFGVIRMGGYATDPVMRGFKNDQLNVQYDGGIKVSCACPNRMDPITTHVQAEDLEKIEIIKGPYSVRYGQMMGGIVNLVMKRPQPVETFQIKADLEGGFESNGEGSRGRLGVAANSSFFNLYFSGATKDYGNYQNGSSAIVPSSFRVNDYSLTLAFLPIKNHLFQISWRQAFARDVLHAGLPMDTREDNTHMWSLDYSAKNISSKFFSIIAKAYLSDINHIMDNARRPNSSMVKAVTDVTSKSLGGRLELGTSFIKNSLWYFGADLNRVEKDGVRERAVSMNPCNMMMFDPPKQFTDPVWQNSVWTDAGLFTELRYSFRPNVTILAGARGDYVTSINNDPAPQFVKKYGDVGEITETNFSASLSINYDFDPTTSVKFAAGRGVRSANMTERYINHQNIGQDLYEYVGNPNLKPEINHQIEIALEKKLQRFSFAGNIFYASIQNYITAAVNPDIHRFYLPCKEPTNAKQFLNLDRATQTGFELNLNGQLSRDFNAYGYMAYTRAQNHDWDEPLPEIPPLEGKLALRYNYHSGLFWLEADGRFASNQERYAESFGETETPAFSVYNFFSGFKPTYYLEFQIGVQNIFDKTYYEHLNRHYRNQPISSIVWEPGRNFIFLIKLHY